MREQIGFFHRRVYSYKHDRFCMPQSYKKKAYNIKYNKWRIKPRNLEEDKLFTQVDLMYIEAMDKLINND